MVGVSDYGSTSGDPVEANKPSKESPSVGSGGGSSAQPGPRINRGRPIRKIHSAGSSSDDGAIKRSVSDSSVSSAEEKRRSGGDKRHPNRKVNRSQSAQGDDDEIELRIAEIANSPNARQMITDEVSEQRLTCVLDDTRIGERVFIGF